jgi:two-component SAPR family response regulator
VAPKEGSHSTVVVRRSAGRQILVLLALHRGGVSDAELKEAVWPDVPGSAAQRRFLTTMSELRLSLQAAAGLAVLRQQVNAVAGRVRYWLDPGAVQVDLWRLHDLLDAAAATVDPAGRRGLLRAAAELGTGELAEAWDHEWLAADRERVARHMLDLRVHLADLEPDHGRAVRLLRTALRDAPANEAVHRRLLYRHAAAGDPAGLRRAVASMRQHLTALHVEPEPTTVELTAALLADTTGRDNGGSDPAERGQS